MSSTQVNRRWWAVAPLMILVAGPVLLPRPAAPTSAAAGVDAAKLVPVGPLRLADTREPGCGCVRLDATTIRVAVAGREGIDPGITAAAITLTATGASVGTYVTAWPAGAARPATSTVNVRPGPAVANSAIIPVGVDGAIDVFAPAPVEVILDVSAVFVPVASTRPGRFVPTTPTRVLDTRDLASPLPRGGSVTVPLPAGVAVDAAGLMVNVTSADATDPGFLTGRAAGSAASTSSFLNPDGSGAPVAASVILPASPGGVTIETSGGGHVVVDLVGWFTGPSAAASDEGLFVATSPTRLVDSRVVGPRLWRGGTREVAVAAEGFVPAHLAAALVTNVTLDRADAAGFVTAFPAGTPRPPTSSLNAPARNVPVANLAVVPLSERGVAFFANNGADLIVDVTGWFTGSPVGAPEPPSPNAPPPLRALLIGDSTLAALDVVPQSQHALRGFEPVLDAAPCRRLVQPSCRSAYTGRIPATAVLAIAGTPGPVDVLVVKAGYNEGTLGFESDVVQVILAARARGIDLVLWLTYSEGTGSQLWRYEANNATIRRLAASGTYPELEVADWRGFAAGAGAVGWYAADRVHLNGAGAWATADYVSRWVAHATHRACPLPWTPGGEVEPRCANPDAMAGASGVPDLRGLYGL